MIHPKLVAKAALFNKKGELLLLRRSATDRIRPGGWDLPGGCIDGEETSHQAVIREIEEEVGISLTYKDVSLMYSTTNFYDHGSTIRFIFVGYIDGEEEIKLSYEHDQYKWLPLEEALALYDHPVYVDAIRYLVDHNLLHS